MKNYKKILFLAVMVFLCSSCNENGCGGDSVFLRSYVAYYVDGPIKLYNGGYFTRPHVVGLRFLESDHEGYKATLYSAPEIGEIGNEKFLEIAERNGDRSYNREDIFVYYTNRVACAHNFKSMEVVCTNAAWDDTHPTGTPLNDLVTIEYNTYKEFIRSGYTTPKEGLKNIRKALSDVSEDDLSILAFWLDICFDKLPVAGSYEIKVTMITTENMEKVATCTFKVE